MIIDPGTAIAAGISGIGSLFAAKGASDSQDANNKAIKAQNKYDQQVYDYNLQETDDRYQFNINETKIARQNNEQQLAYREQIDLDNYTAALKQRNRDFRAQKNAYVASEEDYKDYKGLNEQIADQARNQTLNKFREQRAGLRYSNQQSKLAELETMQGLSNQMRGAKNIRRDAKADFRLADRKANRAYNQQIDQLDISERKLNANRSATMAERALQQGLGDDKEEALNIAKNKKIDSLRLTRDRAAEASRQTQLEAIDAYGDAKLAKQQNVDSINAKFTRANQGLDQSDRRIEQQFTEQKTANQQRKDALDAEYKTQELQGKFSDARAKLSFTESDLGETQQQSNIADTLEDQELVKNQNLDSLTDEQKYQLFEVEGNLERLQGTLDKDGNFVGGDLNALKLRYESESAARAFEVEAKMFEGLTAEGSVLARGQRGRSATRNLSSVMASLGRQQAQLADSILRAESIFGNQKQSIEDQIERGNKLKGMYGDTLTRKKGDIRETFARQKTDKTRLTDQSKERAKNIKTRYDEELRFTTEGLKDKLENRNRMKKDITEIQSDQKARKKLEKAFNAEDVTLNEADKIRETTDQQENLDRSKLDRDRTTDNAQRNFNLEQRAFTEAESYARQEYQNSLSKLNKEQRLMMNSLNNQLKQYGIDIAGNKKQRKAALQDFKTSQKAAQNAFDSSERDFGLTSKEITQKRVNAQTNKLIRRSEYKSSITSAINARKSVMEGIRIDEYSANLTADKQRMVEPQRSPKPPAPIKYPRTIYQDPRKPGTPPPPVKGAMQSGAVFQAIGSGLGRLAQMDWSGPNLD